MKLILASLILISSMSVHAQDQSVKPELVDTILENVDKIFIPIYTGNKEDDSLTLIYSARDRTPLYEIPVYSTTLELTFYDDAIVDGDSISVFVNGLLIAKHIFLQEWPQTVCVEIDPNGENEISMMAETLGAIVPNTAIMYIGSGDDRREVFMSSSLQKNATVRVRYKGR